MKYLKNIEIQVKENKKIEDDVIYQVENERYLKALSELNEKDIEKFEEEGVIPKSLDDIVTLGYDMIFKFNKLPNVSPSTGGYVFDDIKLHDSSELEFESYIDNNNY